MFSFLSSLLIFLPSSSSLSYFFNFGSMLGMVMFFQIFSGILLLMNYNSLDSFGSVMYMMLEVNYGWLMKIIHSNNASIIFLFLYLHLYKNVMFFSYRLSKTWYSGLFMMVFAMGAGFSGYVIVGSQMSLWAAMVITSLISVVPLNGEALMYFIWGGYSISWITLQLLFLIHFVLPFLLIIVLVFHLLFLHETGSTSLIFSHSGLEKLTFYPFFWLKDLFNLFFIMFFFFFLLLFPYALGEVELFEEANFLSSPAHIIPEWYFCVSYAILRSVPSKGLGVLIMAFSILVLFFYPLSYNYITPFSNISFSFFMVFFFLQIYLTYLGFSPISQPFMMMALLSTFLYFFFHSSIMLMNVISFFIFTL